MLKKFRRLLTSARDSEPQNDPLEAEIPRYPPFDIGMPITDLDALLATQSDLLSNIRKALPASQEEYDTYVLPVIRRYADHVHLLPASEGHHHRGAGGLLRHGLEVGFWAAQKSGDVKFCPEETPQVQRDSTPRWHLAAFFAGLLHDIGKPITDVVVTDKSAHTTWDPSCETISEWAEESAVNRYFLRWKKHRHKQHEKYSLVRALHIIGKDTVQYLSKSGDQIRTAMLEAISDSESQHPLSKNVVWADQVSVERDLKAEGNKAHEYGNVVTVDRYVCDALRRLLRNGTLKVNCKGAKMWYTQDGLFLVWKSVAEDVTRLLSEDNVSAIPKDHDTLADVLLERDLAIPYKQGENGIKQRYWPLAPALLNELSPEQPTVNLSTLLLSSEYTLYGQSEPPGVTAALVGEAAFVDRSKNVSMKPATALPAPEQEQQPQPIVEKKPEVARGTEDKILRQPEYPTQVQRGVNNGQGTLASEETKISILNAYVRNAIEDLVSGDHKLGTVLVRLDDAGIGILYPESAKRIGPPEQVRKSLHLAGMLKTDSLHHKNVLKKGAHNYLVLTDDCTLQLDRVLKAAAVELPSVEESRVQRRQMIPTKDDKKSNKLPANKRIHHDSSKKDEKENPISSAKSTAQPDDKESVYTEALALLRQQMGKREGAWVDGVEMQEQSGVISASIEVLDRVAKSYASKMSERTLRNHISKHTSSWSIRGGKVHYDTVEEAS